MQSSSAVPCRDAKRVDSHDVPPLRPEYLSRPYLWQVHRQSIDENNPYNLVDRAEKVRAARPGATPPEIATAVPGGGAAAQSAPVAVPTPSVSSAPPATPAGGVDLARLGLTDGDLRDLFLLVELSQERALATFLQPGSAGADSVRVAFAYSQAFEQRVRDAGSAADGAVLLFTVQPKAPTTFLPNFTFVQGGQTFAPRRDDPAQLGILSGRLGTLGQDELVLGYVVLPGSHDVRRAMDVYWDDRQIAATFLP